MRAVASHDASTSQLCLCAVISGADCWVEVALYGQQPLAFLCCFLPSKHGVPSYDQLGIVFARLDAQQFQRCFAAWVERFTEAARGVIAIDGKTLRRSFDHAAGQGPIQMISAWSESRRLVLGQHQVSDTSNEITAIPKLLELLELQGAVVALDAMRCQRAIAEQIVSQGGDYVLGIKGNQGTLHEDVALLFDEQQGNFAGLQVTVHETFDKSLHWVMDMVFRDDECRIRSENAPANFATIKHMASNLLRRARASTGGPVVTSLPGMRTFSIHCSPNDAFSRLPWDKDHRRRAHVGHVLGVVTGAADHLHVRQVQVPGGAADGGDA